MSSPSNDIVIVGGGVVGSATAYYLAKSGMVPGRRITIIEKDTSYACCSTARSAGGLRQQFSTAENIAMSRVTLDLIRNLKETFGPDADVGFQEQGYLLLASDEGADVLQSNVEVQRAQGAETLLLAPDALRNRFPWLNMDGIAAGSFGPSGEGWLDPSSLMNLFRTAARSAGVQLVPGEVVAIDTSSGVVTQVTLANGATISCGSLVNAAGAGAGAVARLAGIALPVEPRKRYVYVIDCRDAPAELHRAPLTVDASGAWFRPEGRLFITGISPEEDQEPPASDLADIDHVLFTDEVWPRIAARVPAFEAVKVVNAWAGYYDYNTLDQNAIIGAHPEIRNFFFANGFSGHGLQQAAAAGRAVSELILHGAYQTIDLTKFGYGRIARQEPMRELNII